MKSRVPAIVFIIVVAASSLAGCSRRESTVSMEALGEERAPVQESWNPEMFINENGLRRMHMRARFMARYEREDSTYMVLSGAGDEAERVRVNLFDEAGDSSAVVTADRLTYYDSEKRFVARGNVIVVTNEGRRLASETLAWSEYDRRVRAPGFFRYLSDTENISGYDLFADEDLKNYTISRPSGVFIPEEQ